MSVKRFSECYAHDDYRCALDEAVEERKAVENFIKASGARPVDVYKYLLYLLLSRTNNVDEAEKYAKELNCCQDYVRNYILYMCTKRIQGCDEYAKKYYPRLYSAISMGLLNIKTATPDEAYKIIKRVHESGLDDVARRIYKNWDELLKWAESYEAAQKEKNAFNYVEEKIERKKADIIAALIKKYLETGSDKVLEEIKKLGGSGTIDICYQGLCREEKVEELVRALKEAREKGLLKEIEELMKYRNVELDKLSLGDLENLIRLVNDIIANKDLLDKIAIRLNYDNLVRLKALAEILAASRIASRSYLNPRAYSIALDKINRYLSDAEKYFPDLVRAIRQRMNISEEQIENCVLSKYGLVERRYDCSFLKALSENELKNLAKYYLYRRIKNYLDAGRVSEAVELAIRGAQKGLVDEKTVRVLTYYQNTLLWLRDLEDALRKGDFERAYIDVKEALYAAKQTGDQELVNYVDKVYNEVVLPYDMITRAMNILRETQGKGIAFAYEAYKLINNLKNEAIKKGLKEASQALSFVSELARFLYLVNDSLLLLRIAADYSARHEYGEDWRKTLINGLSEALTAYQIYKYELPSILSYIKEPSIKEALEKTYQSAGQVFSGFIEALEKLGKLIAESKTGYETAKYYYDKMGLKLPEPSTLEKGIEWYYKDFVSYLGHLAHSIENRFKNIIGSLLSAPFYAGLFIVSLPLAVWSALKIKEKIIMDLIHGRLGQAAREELEFLKGMIPRTPGEVLGMAMLAGIGELATRLLPRISRLMTAPLEVAFPEVRLLEIPLKIRDLIRRSRIRVRAETPYGVEEKIYYMDRIESEKQILEDVYAGQDFRKTVEEIEKKYRLSPEEAKYVARVYADSVKKLLETYDTELARRLVEKASRESIESVARLYTKIATTIPEIDRIAEEIKESLKPPSSELVYLDKYVERVNKLIDRLEEIKSELSKAKDIVPEKVSKQIDSLVKELESGYERGDLAILTRLEKVSTDLYNALKRLLAIKEKVESNRYEWRYIEQHRAELEQAGTLQDLVTRLREMDSEWEERWSEDMKKLAIAKKNMIEILKRLGLDKDAERLEKARNLEETFNAYIKAMKDIRKRLLEADKKTLAEWEKLRKELTNLENDLRKLGFSPHKMITYVEIEMKNPLMLPKELVEDLAKIGVKAETIRDLGKLGREDVARLTLGQLEQLAKDFDKLSEKIDLLKEYGEITEEEASKIKEIDQLIKTRIDYIRHKYYTVIKGVRELADLLDRVGEKELAKKLLDDLRELPRKDKLVKDVGKALETLKGKITIEELARLENTVGKLDPVVKAEIERFLKEMKEKAGGAGVGGIKVTEITGKLIEAPPEIIEKLIKLAHENPEFKIGEYTIRRTIEFEPGKAEYRLHIEGKGYFADLDIAYIYRNGKVYEVVNYAVDPSYPLEVREELLEVAREAIEKDPASELLRRVYIEGTPLEDMIDKSIIDYEVARSGIRNIEELLRYAIPLGYEDLPSTIQDWLRRLGIVTVKVYQIPGTNGYLLIVNNIPRTIRMYRWRLGGLEITIPTLKIQGYNIGLLPATIYINIEVQEEELRPKTPQEEKQRLRPEEKTYTPEATKPELKTPRPPPPPPRPSPERKPPTRLPLIILPGGSRETYSPGTVTLLSGALVREYLVI